MQPPVADKRPVTTTVHDVALTDDYGWLRADNWQEVMRDPSVLADGIRAYLDAENAYTAEMMADTEALQKTLFAEMKGRIKEDDSTVPAPDGPYAYAVKYVEGAEHPIYVRTPRDGGAEEILLDGNTEAEGAAYFHLGGVSHSPDHDLLAWAFDGNGSEYYTLKVRKAETGADLEDVIEDTGGSAVWANDGKTLFYIRLDANHRPSKVFRHVVGTDPASDVLVYEEKDTGFYMDLEKSQSDRFIIINTSDHQTSEIRLIDADAPESAPVMVAAREVDHEYNLDHGGDTLFILTNCDGAEDFKIMTAPVAAPGRENWQDLVPYEEGRLILSLTAYKGHLVRLERANGLPRIVIRRLSDGAEHEIAFDEEAYSLGLAGGFEFDTTSLRFSYSSMTTPSRVYDYDMESRDRVLRKEQEVPSGHDPDAYVTRRLMAPAEDGETVPVTLLYRKDTPLDGSAPCLLYGYGSYGISIPASFSTTALSLVDRGFVYAIAHIRGGKDKGYRWYKLGRREHKTNTFTDYIAAGRFLVAEKITSKGKIVGHGGSAGGLLMGAVVNMAPDLFAGILAEVPFVDVLNTILDDTLPLTPPEWPEWGDPIRDVKAFETIRSYSPYDNVEAKAYPPILAVGGLTDPRVTYWEPAKWVARLRATKTDDNVLLLKTNMEAGHGGASGRFARLEEVALNYAFALKVTGKLD